jgi:hypothetical protein
MIAFVIVWPIYKEKTNILFCRYPANYQDLRIKSIINCNRLKGQSMRKLFNTSSKLVIMVTSAILIVALLCKVS